jgi:signal transduction histidine kinase
MVRSLIDYYKEMDLSVCFNEHLGQLPKISGDPKLLRCAFSNLVSNAMKYSAEDGLVEISGRAEDGAVHISITDHGIGIPAAELQRVRERFFRGSNAGAIPGTGVGLTLVQQILEQHEGHMTIESELGRWTRITVSLPSQAGNAQAVGRPLEQDLVH